MKKYIQSIIFAAGMFYAGSSSAQTMRYCILNDVATHCPAVILPAVAPGIVSDQQSGGSAIPANYNTPYDMQAMSSGYNTSTPAVPASSSVNGVASGTNMKEIVARRRAYSGASAVSPDNSSISMLYPNPVLANTRITLNKLTASPVTIDILDLNGNILRTFDYAAGIYNLDVDMSGLPQGTYSVRVYGQEIPMENLKVVKQ